MSPHAHRSASSNSAAFVVISLLPHPYRTPHCSVHARDFIGTRFARFYCVAWARSRPYARIRGEGGSPIFCAARGGATPPQELALTERSAIRFLLTFVACFA